MNATTNAKRPNGNRVGASGFSPRQNIGGLIFPPELKLVGGFMINSKNPSTIKGIANLFNGVSKYIASNNDSNI